MLEVLEASGLITVQDMGRFGWRRYGVPASGPMDPFAFQAANLLAGNSPTPAALEIGGGELTLRATQDCVIAAAGCGFKLMVQVWEFELWSSYFIRSGWTIRLSQNGHGMWVYLALAGGVQAPTVLGSRSTYLRGHFGGFEGRALEAGDFLEGASTAHLLMESSGQTLPKEARPMYREQPTLEIVLGPQGNEIKEQSLSTLLSNPYDVSISSDRMGYRLQGPRLEHRDTADLTSAGVAMGSIQLPADGSPIVMMADCATTGGYPLIASVVSADLPLLAQCTPGRDSVCFRQTTVEDAQRRNWDMQRGLITGILKADDWAGEA